MGKHYITSWIDTEIDKIPRVSATLSKQDRWGTFKARWAINRMKYSVEPGIYAVGNPDRNSAVLVSANYKLSFDVLRRELGELDAWILVIDTKGINVWCAAGKGTFGTAEIVSRIERTQLRRIVDHRKIIVPQLGAPGVAAHEVEKLSGFSVTYGPIRSLDILPFFEAGMVATREMRQIRFPFRDRLMLVPAEVVGSLKYLILIIAVFVLLGGLSRNGYSTNMVVGTGVNSVMNLLIAYFAGTVLGPLLLPWLPGRSFSLKGFFPGMSLFLISFLTVLGRQDTAEIIAWMFIIPAVSSFLTMNFTGSSTYTSLSGVKKEMRVAAPVQITAAVIGTVLWIGSRFI